MKKVLLTMLAVVVVFGVLAGAGFAGYRYGFMQGASGEGTSFLRGNGLGWNRMPMHDFDRNIGPGFHNRSGGFNMMGRGGFGFFTPLRLLLPIAFWGVLIWLAYKLLTGWRLTLVQTNTPPVSTRVEPVQTDEDKQEKSG